MNEEAPLVMTIGEGSETTAFAAKESKKAFNRWATFGAAFLWVVVITTFSTGTVGLGTTATTRAAFPVDVALLGKSNDETSSSVPPPSEQDWCMAPGQYEFFGTYRSPEDAAEGGLFYAPGRFQGVVLTDQNDETVYFHLVNVTYGNALAPHRHVPDEGDPGAEYDRFDAFCFIHPVKPSGCYVPKYFPKHNHKSRCVKLAFPSMTGSALCRQLAMAEFTQRRAMTMGIDTAVEEWAARLSTATGNEYDGQLTIMMRNFTTDGGSLKVPLTHWLTSDDQTLEASFQVGNYKTWDPSAYPEIPGGCEEAHDLMDILDEKEKNHHHHHHEDQEFPKPWKVDQERFLRQGCPFGAMHRHLTLPAWHQHVLDKA